MSPYLAASGIGLAQDHSRAQGRCRLRHLGANRRDAAPRGGFGCDIPSFYRRLLSAVAHSKRAIIAILRQLLAPHGIYPVVCEWQDRRLHQGRTQRFAPSVAAVFWGLELRLRRMTESSGRRARQSARRPHQRAILRKLQRGSRSGERWFPMVCEHPTGSADYAQCRLVYDLANNTSRNVQPERPLPLLRLAVRSAQHDGGTYFSPKRTFNGFTLGVGPIFLLPTATDELLGAGKWGVGPTGVVVWQGSR